MYSEPPEKEISDQRLQKRLNNKATHYLSRYASTTARLETVLRRFAKRKIGDVPPAQLQRCIKLVIAQCVSAGYVDDSAFIRSRFRAARHAGQSVRMTTTKLKAAGMPAEQIEAEWQAVLGTDDELDSPPIEDGQPDNPASEEEIELVAAIQFARKKKLGCFGEPAHDADLFAIKHSTLGRLARRGFSYEICAELLSFETSEDALARADEISARIPSALS